MEKSAPTKTPDREALLQWERVEEQVGWTGNSAIRSAVCSCISGVRMVAGWNWIKLFFDYCLFLKFLVLLNLEVAELEISFFLLLSPTTDVYHLGAKSCSMKLVSKVHQGKYGNLLGDILSISGMVLSHLLRDGLAF